MTKVERLKKFMQDCWDGRKAAAGPFECTYRALPPELDGQPSMLDEALAEEFERGREAGSSQGWDEGYAAGWNHGLNEPRSSK